MPELPEVETTKRGISPHILNQTITSAEIRQPKLRWPVSTEIDSLPGAEITAVTRRAKYLFVQVSGRNITGHLILHLGMSGSLRVIDPDADLRKHDHVLITLANGLQLRFHDPRRFGCLLFTAEDPNLHPLVRDLGPEPLSDDFTSDVLSEKASKRKMAIKPFLMDNKVVVGVGNIYACESLHTAGINPKRQANRISKARLDLLVAEVKRVLQRSIDQGGTTLRDFLHEDGTAGYFKQQLNVYDRESQLCKTCGSKIKRITQAQRSTFYCPNCQK